MHRAPMPQPARAQPPVVLVAAEPLVRLVAGVGVVGGQLGVFAGVPDPGRNVDPIGAARARPPPHMIVQVGVARLRVDVTGHAPGPSTGSTNGRRSSTWAPSGCPPPSRLTVSTPITPSS